MIAAAALSLWMSTPGPPASAASDPGARVSAALVAATLVAILWYTLETRRARISQDDANATALLAEELRTHPWLEATGLKPEIRRPEREGKPPDLVLYLPVINRGMAPARDMRFGGGGTVTYVNDAEHDYLEPIAAGFDKVVVPIEHMRHDAAQRALEGPQARPGAEGGEPSAAPRATGCGE